MKLNFIEIYNSEKKLYKWLSKNGYYGYDPFDLYSQIPHYRKVIYNNHFFIKKTISRCYSVLDKFAPSFLRKIFKVKKTVNNKGLGLIGNGYLLKYKICGENFFKEKAYEIAKILLENRNKNYPGYCWGYPFDWQSRIFIPEGTPSVVVSYTVGDFFFKMYEEFNEEKFLEVSKGVCEFIIQGLNKTTIDKDTICLSYTPLDYFQVHNANLFGAEFLIRVGKKTNNSSYIDLGLRATNFALKQQLQDGSLNYWGDEQNDKKPNSNDHYHVGFEIRMLASIATLTKNEKIISAAKRYYNYYQKNFFEGKGNDLIPKMIPTKTFPLDIHACAEAIILNVFIYEIWNDNKS